LVKADRIVDPAPIGPERAALLQPELPEHEATPSPTFSPASLVRSFSQAPVSKSIVWAATVRATPAHLGQQQPQTSRAATVPQATNSKSHMRDAPASAPLTDSEIIPTGPVAVQPPGLGAGLQPAAQPLTRSIFSVQFQSLHPAEVPTGAALATPDRASRALPKGFSTNLARSIGETGHGRAELILEPAELGRLRFDIVTQGDKVQINLAVERPETLTLLRNHADELRQEFRDAGFTGGTLNFSQWGQQEEGKAPPELAQGDITPQDLMPTEPAPASRPRTASDGLDLRL
jgi:flagellar hook-length control protein FliK